MNCRKLGQGIAIKGLAEDVANLTTLSNGMKKLAHSIVRQGMAEGVAIVATFPTHVTAKLSQGIVRQGIAEGVANLITLPMGWQNWGRV